jgi:hypothetical protein
MMTPSPHDAWYETSVVLIALLGLLANFLVMVWRAAVEWTRTKFVQENMLTKLAFEQRMNKFSADMEKQFVTRREFNMYVEKETNGEG